MKKLIPALAILLLFMCLPDLRAQSQIDMNTYYVSPYGSYFKIRLYPRGELAGACDTGSFYVNEEKDNLLQYCPSAGQWSLISGVWLQPGDTIYYDDSSKDVVIPHISNVDEKAGSQYKLQLYGTNPALRIETDTSGGTDYDIGLKIIAGATEASLNFDTSNDHLSLSSTGGTAELVLGESSPKKLSLVGSSAGIGDDDPDAHLEVVRGDPANVLEVSSSDAAAGDILMVQDAGGDAPARVGINNPLPSAPLEVTDFSDSRRIGFLRLDGTQVQDIRYTGNGGATHEAFFEHTGPDTDPPGYLSFQNNDIPLAKLTNLGELHASTWSKVDDITTYKLVEFEVGEGDANEITDTSGGSHNADPFLILSDAGTDTSVDCPEHCQYIETDVIGILTSTTSTDGGMMILGIADGPAWNTQALRLAGVVPASQDEAPAVSMGGLHTRLMSHDNIDDPATNDRTILRVNHITSNRTNFSVFTADGNWGIGMNAGDPQPQDNVTIHDVLKIGPTHSPPNAWCDEDSDEGTTYIDDDGGATWCICSLEGGRHWEKLYGSGICGL